MTDADDDERREEERLRARAVASKENRPTEEEYLRKVEALAQAVGKAASDERGAASYRVEEAETPLQLAIAELLCNLRMYHYEGDGCIEGH